MTAKDDAPDAKAYNAVIGRALLRGIWLMESRFDMKPQALDGDAPELRYDVRTPEAEAVLEPSGALYGFIEFSASARRKRQRILHVHARYFVSYHVEGGCEQDIAELFVQRVGRLAAYPYFRALAASLSGQAGVAMPPLPIISFQPRSVGYAKSGELSKL